MDPDIPYLLLTPGPLTTSRSVREAMLQDYCTWDDDYNQIVQSIRQRLVSLAAAKPHDYTSVLIQGSGTFSVEAVLGSAIGTHEKLLIVSNGAYGQRMVDMASRLKIPHQALTYPETIPVDPADVEQALRQDAGISHVSMVHCETTTGMLNDAEGVGQVVRHQGRALILDAMSSFGGIPLEMDAGKIDFLISSANKCIQGTPGFAFVVGRRDCFEACRGKARSLSLDLYGQWREMEDRAGKWRYTSPTHVVRAFKQALDELDAEGGVAARYARYRNNQRLLVEGMRRYGFRCLLPDHLHSPIITSFWFPADPNFSFRGFYDSRLKAKRFVIYPGKVSGANTFRIGTIGNVFAEDVELLIDCIGQVVEELDLQVI